jgi:hypothetical protein
MLLGPPVKSQLSDAFYSACQKQPTGGCQEKEIAGRWSIEIEAKVKK